MDTSTHEEATVVRAGSVPGFVDDAWIPPAARPGVSFRTPHGRVVIVPAPVAIVGVTALFAAALLSAFEPQTVRAASLDDQAASLLAWETAERARVAETLALLEPEVRELRRVALRAGIVPAETIDCEAAGTAHLARHLREAAWLTESLVTRTQDSAELDLLPSRSPIDLAATWVVSVGPVSPGIHVSSTMGARPDPFTGHRRAHQGLDLSAPAGTPVVAPSTAVVEFAGAVGASSDHARALLGNHVLLRHGQSGYTTLYAHLDTIDVKVGQKVKAGDRLGTVGSTGRSTAPHLHYQVMRGEGNARENLDPLYFITDSVLVREGRDVWYTPAPRAIQAAAGVGP